MDGLDDRLDLLLEQPQGVGVGQHQADHALIADRLERDQIDIAPLIRGELDRLETAHSHRGRVGAVGAVGDQHLGPVEIAPGQVIGPHHQHPGKFAVRPSRRVEADPGKTRNLFERFLQSIHQLQAALGQPVRLQGMAAGKALQGRGGFIDFGVVFHGTGAQRVKMAVDAEILLRQAHIVTDQLQLADFRQLQLLPD